jgi:hypothetical protein
MPTIDFFERYPIRRRPPEGIKLLRPNYRDSLPFVDRVDNLPGALGLVDYRGDLREAGIYFLQAYCPPPPLGGPFDDASRRYITLDGFAGSCVAGIPATQGKFGLYLAMDIFPPEHENIRRMLSYLNRGGVIRAVYLQCVNRRFPTFETVRNTIWLNWQLGTHRIRIITGSPECATSSTATRNHDFPHRGPHPTLEPLTPRAKRDDAAMDEFMTLCEQIVDSNRPNPNEDSTTTAIIENPADGVFSQLPVVRRRVMFGGWNSFRADHCVMATHESPNKRTMYFVYGKIAGFNWRCTQWQRCEWLLPNSDVHRVGIADYNAHPGQLHLGEGDPRRSLIPPTTSAALASLALLATDRVYHERLRSGNFQRTAGPSAGVVQQQHGDSAISRATSSRPVRDSQRNSNHASTSHAQLQASSANRRYAPTARLSSSPVRSTGPAIRRGDTARFDAQTARADVQRSRSSPAHRARRVSFSAGAETADSRSSPARSSIARAPSPESGQYELIWPEGEAYLGEVIGAAARGAQSQRPAASQQEHEGPRPASASAVGEAYATAANRIARFPTRPRPTALELHCATMHTSVDSLYESVRHWHDFQLTGANGQIIPAHRITRRDLTIDGPCYACMVAHTNAPAVPHSHHQRDQRDRVLDARARASDPESSAAPARR